MRIILCAGGLLLALHAVPASACGHCVEDKVAAVYDHAAAQQAFARKQQVAFFGIDGPLMLDEQTRRDLEALARGIPLVDQASVRISLESASLSVAFDPRRASFAQVQRALERKLESKKLTLLPLRVMEGPAKIAQPPQ